MWWRTAIGVAWALAASVAAPAQTPPAQSRAAPVVPDKAGAAPPHLQSPIEALAEDGAQYARLYGVPLTQAMRELEAQQESVPATDALASEFKERLAGITIAHEGGFRIVVLLTGDAPVEDRTIAAGGLLVPVTFRTGAPATREQILAAIAAHQADIRAALHAPPGMGVDPRTGMLAVMVKASDVPGEGAETLAARLGEIASVPTEVRAWSDADVNLAADGGGRVIGFDPAIGRKAVCTSGFVVTDGTQTGLSTAAHCPDQLSYVEPDKSEVPLTMVGAWGAFYQDVQIHVEAGVGAGALPPFFYADKGKTLLRPVTSWRNRTSTRAGDVVCHRGERTGYSCAEVEYPDYAPPGDLCAGPCEATWVAVRGPDCKGGDSGGPVFSGTIAFGLVKGSSYTGDGRCRLYYYMSTDYLPPGWTVAVERPALPSVQGPESPKTPETN